MQPFGQRMAVTTMGAEDNVVGSQMGAHANGDGFLADVGMARAVNQTALVRAGQLLLSPPDEEHAAIKREKRFLAQADWLRGQHARVQLRFDAKKGVVSVYDATAALQR